MADIFEYKCPCCGGAVSFDANAQKMKCPYCDSEFDPQAFLNKDKRLDEQQPDDFTWDEDAGHEWDEGEQEQMNVFVCKSCGGEIVGDANTAATECPYCGNQVVLSGRLSGTLKPDYVIPFKFDKEAAKAELKKYVNSKKFAPKKFKQENKLEEIKGIYVPFWLFDSDTDAAVSYEATTVRTWSDSKYNYTETSFFDVFRAGSMRFENIPCDGSSKMADDLMESIEPFNFTEAVTFQTAYLAGYLADKYDVTMEDSIDRANNRVKTSSEDVLRSTIDYPYHSVIPRSSSIQITNGKAKYALYPVWILNTDHNGKKYTFAMNGQTGKFTGNLPIDGKKVFALFMGLTIGIGAIAFIVGRLLGLL